MEVSSYSKHKRIVRGVFNENGLQPRIEEEPRGMSFTVKQSNLELKVTVGSKWVGYSLTLDSGPHHGKVLEISEDTDNYPMEGGYADVTAEILEDAIVCIKSFATEEILSGRKGGRIYLAVPLSSGRYKLAVKGLFFTSVKEIESSRIESMTFMHNV